MTQMWKLHFFVRLAMQTIGIGKLSPNMLLIGFQEKWMSSVTEARDYVKILQAAFDQHLSVGILLVRGGFNLTKMGIENEAFEMDGRGNCESTLM
jgi:hypothetical protein